MTDAPTPPFSISPETSRARWASGLAWAAPLALALWTAGAVDPAAGASLAGFLLLVAFLSPAAPAREAPSPGRWAVAAAIAACLVQLIPLPEAIRAVIAPGPTTARADLHALGLQGGWAPISVDVGATAYEALLWAGAAAALVVFSGRGGAPFGARLVVGALVVLHVFAWFDWLTPTRILPLTTIEDPWDLGQATLRRSDFAGWLINRNHWAALGLILWPLALSWAWSGGRGRRLLGTAAAGGVVVSVIATGSKAGFGIAVLQLLAVAAWLLARLPRKTRWALLAGAAVCLIVAWGPVTRLVFRISTQDVVARAEIYAATAKMGVDSPAVGWGMGTFRSSFPAYQPPGALYSYSHAHCDPLEWIAGAGVFGVALVLGLAWTGVRGARDPRGSPRTRILWALSVAGGAAAACFEFPFHIPAVRFLWLGVLFTGPPATVDRESA